MTQKSVPAIRCHITQQLLYGCGHSAFIFPGFCRTIIPPTLNPNTQLAICWGFTPPHYSEPNTQLLQRTTHACRNWCFHTDFYSLYDMGETRAKPSNALTRHALQEHALLDLPMRACAGHTTGHKSLLEAATTPEHFLRRSSPYLARPEAAPPWSSVRYISE